MLENVAMLCKIQTFQLRQCQKRNSSLNGTTLPAVVDDFFDSALPKTSSYPATRLSVRYSRMRFMKHAAENLKI